MVGIGLEQAVVAATARSMVRDCSMPRASNTDRWYSMSLPVRQRVLLYATYCRDRMAATRSSSDPPRGRDEQH